MDDLNATNQLGEYLQARRNLVTPQQVGLPAGKNRRVTGLRREEVALLAGVSLDYYLRLERGRDSNPSPQVLESLARVFQLDDIETEYLLGLGTHRPRPRRRRTVERVPARLHQLLTALEIPAFVEGRYFDVLASNEIARAFSPRLAPGQNRLRSLLLDAEEREFQDDWENAVVDAIASFRHLIGDDITDTRAVEIVGELSLASARSDQSGHARMYGNSPGTPPSSITRPWERCRCTGRSSPSVGCFWSSTTRTRTATAPTRSASSCPSPPTAAANPRAETAEHSPGCCWKADSRWTRSVRTPRSTLSSIRSPET